MAIRCGRARTLLAPVGGLVDVRGDGGGTGQRRAHDGCVAPGLAARTHASLRSRQPVHERAVSASDGRAWHSMLAVAGPKRLGERGDGELLLLAQDRTHSGQGVRSHDAAWAYVFDDIERFHNPRRRHPTLGYLSPNCLRGTTAIGLTHRPRNGDRALARPNEDRAHCPISWH